MNKRSLLSLGWNTESDMDCNINNNNLESDQKKKRTKIENKIKDGILNPPKLINTVDLFDSQLTFRCASKSDNTKKYNIKIKNKNNKLFFICSCKLLNSNINDDINDDDCQCNHINAVILLILKRYIESVQNTNKDDILENIIIHFENLDIII